MYTVVACMTKNLMFYNNLLVFRQSFYLLVGDGTISLHCGSRVFEEDVSRCFGQELGKTKCF